MPGSEKIKSLPMRETIRNFLKRARNFHRNSTDIYLSGTGSWVKRSLIEEWKQEGSGKRRKKLSGKGIWWAGLHKPVIFSFNIFNEYCERSYLSQTGKFQYIIIAKSLRIH
jgi:hypothetical protein